MLRLLLACAVLLCAHDARARDAGDPITLAWTEGDVAGFTPIYSADGTKRLGTIEYHQHRQGDELEAVRVARFTDGSSDEDRAIARVGTTLRALHGRSVIRDARGRITVDLRIDIAGGRMHGFYRSGGERRTFDERTELAAGTYWGPLVFLVLKNFAANAEDGRVRFRAVAPTPQPRVLTLEIERDGSRTLTRPGGALATDHYVMRPAAFWLIDPIVQAIAPTTQFFVDPGTPPALARYEGPRNYAGQEIRLE